MNDEGALDRDSVRWTGRQAGSHSGGAHMQARDRPQKRSPCLGLHPTSPSSRPLLVVGLGPGNMSIVTGGRVCGKYSRLANRGVRGAALWLFFTVFYP